jgi:hypothetical protein
MKSAEPASPIGAGADEAASALNMLTEILREENFLQSEEIRLADRPPERLAKLREAHKEWIVWRVRKELERMRLGRDADRTRQDQFEEERKREAEQNRRDAEELEKARERERTLKEERERAAREQQRPRGGPSFPWQRRPSGESKDKGKDGYGTDRDGSGRGFNPPPRSQTTAPFPSAANASFNREALIARSGWEAYTQRWAQLNATANSADPPQQPRLRFGDIPWPIFSTGPFSPTNLTAKTVGAFLLSPFHSLDKTPKDRLRAALMQWHPDKFEAKWLHMINDAERPLVTEGVGAVARAINDLLAANR